VDDGYIKLKSAKGTTSLGLSGAGQGKEGIYGKEGT
jgi:hypothetical protein